MIDEEAIKRDLNLWDRFNPQGTNAARKIHEEYLRSPYWNRTKDEAMQGYIEQQAGGEVFTVEKWAQRYGLQIEFKNWDADDKLIISKGGRKFTSTRHAGFGGEGARGFLKSLQSEFQVFEMSEGFPDWCAETGGNSDSIADKATWKQIRADRNRFIAQFGEECYRVLINSVQEV